MASRAMLGYLNENWGWIALRGALSIAFGALAIAWPGITLAALVLLWGAYALADGALALVAAFRIRDRGKPFWALAIVGMLGIAAGIATFVTPALSALVLLSVIATWALLMGAFQIGAAIRLRREIEHEWLLALSGALSVVFGLLSILAPGEGAVALIWTIGLYAIAFGVALLLLGLRVRGYAGRALRV